MLVLAAMLLLGVLVTLAVLDPIRFDGWYHWLDRRHTPLSWSAFVEGARDTYLHANPRLGQFATIAVYGDSLVLTVIICAITIAAAVWLVAAIALGRVPKRGDGEFVATMLAIWCVCVPQFGPVLTYKPYLTNYVTGALPGLALLATASIQLRTPCSGVLRAPAKPDLSIHVRHPVQWSAVGTAGATLAALLVGVAAGMGNEHLGPGLCIALAVAICLSRRQERVRSWLIAAAIGVCVGAFLLLTAPGQQERYGGIGNVGVAATILNRHPLANVAIALLAPALCLGTAPWFVLAKRKPSGWVCLLALGFAVITGLVTLGSPKIAARLFFVPAALLGAAAAVALGDKGRFATRHLSAAILAATMGGMLYLNLRQYQTYERRFTRVATAATGESVLVPPIPKGFPQWTLRDDFRNPNIVKILSQSLGFTHLGLEGEDLGSK